MKATNPWVRIFINDIHADPNLAMLGRAARWSFFDGKTGADLARSTGIPYRRLTGYLCGYWSLRFEEIDAIENILGHWKCEASKQTAVMNAAGKI